MPLPHSSEAEKPPSESASPNPEAISFLLYNIQQIVSASNNQERLAELVIYLNKKIKELNPTVIILTEAFLGNARDELEKNFPGYLYVPPSKGKGYFSAFFHGIDKLAGGALGCNSGVAMLLNGDYFKNTEGAKETKEIDVNHLMFLHAASYDRFAPKGLTHVIMTKDGKRSHFIGAHTQAQYKGHEDQIITTFAQLAEVSEYIRALPTDEPIIFAGDLNVLTTLKDSPIDVKIMEYLFHPLYKHDTSGNNSYDPEKNLLAKASDPAGIAGTLDYIFSRGYTKNDGKILTDTTFNRASENTLTDISDHFPLFISLEQVDPQRLAPSIVEDQKAILARLLCAVLKHNSKDLEIYFSVCNLVAHYDALSEEEKEKLGDGESFFNYCIQFKQPTPFTSFCPVSKPDNRSYQALGVLLNCEFSPEGVVTVELSENKQSCCNLFRSQG